jgi:hypothetical protein
VPGGFQPNCRFRRAAVELGLPTSARLEFIRVYA